MLEIAQVETEEQLQLLRELQAEHIAWDRQLSADLGYDATLLDYQYSQEVARLPGKFVPPDGRLLLARYDSQAAGCAALCKLEAEYGELKRLYVRPQFRGKRIGRLLVEAIVREAREVGYQWLRLETVTFMKEAQAIYYAVGFKQIEPYYGIPEEFQPIAVFMELSLRREGQEISL